MLSAAIVDNLLSAPVLAFVVALAATFLKSDIKLPQGLYPVLSTYLLLAIGLKGGKGLAKADPADLWQPLIAALALGVVTPLVAYAAMRRLGRIGVIDSAAIAAHYGSVSAVTFTVVLAFLEAEGEPTETFLAGLLAVLEIIGIVGVMLTISVDRSAWWLAIPLFIYGIGVGFDSAQLTNVILTDVPPQRSGGASSVTSTLRQVGSTLGSAMLGTVLFVSLGLALTNDLTVNQPQLSEEQRTQIVDEVVDSSGEAIIPLEQQPGMADVAAEAKQSYTRAVQIMAAFAGGAMVIGLIASFGLPADRRREEDDEEQRLTASA
jgi:hypothetical protein